jgi:hypothetical protein
MQFPMATVKKMHCTYIHTSVEELVINVDIESDDSDSDLSFHLGND